MPTGATPKLVRRAKALEILAGHGITEATFDKWRENRTIRPVPIPHKWEHYRTADLLRLADPPQPTNTTTP